MSINLHCDNRSITKDGKYSYLIDNYSSLSSTFTLMNTEGFFANSYILVGNIGSENTEILQIKKVNPVTNAVTFANFTATAIGAGIATVAITNAGTGYQPGEILTVIQTGAVGGSVRVATIGGGGAIATVTVDQPGYAYSAVAGLVTTGGGNNDATIEILTITTNSSATSILFASAQAFIAGQPVEVFTSLGVSRGTGVVSASSDPTSATMALIAPGIVGTVAGDTVVVGDVTKFAHAESTKVTVIQYNQVRFFRTNSPTVPNVVPYTSASTNQDKSITQTTTSTIGTPRTTTYTQPDDPSSITTVDFTPPIIYAGATALTAPAAIQVNDFYTTYIDTVNSTGYGWFSFYNSTTAVYSAISNPIPYSGFPQNTVKKVFETFDSSMNTKELKLITQGDRFNWLNEGLSYMTNELNLGNWEYLASEELALNLTSGVAKYLLPQDFSDLLFINDSKGIKMDSYSATFERAYSSSIVKYAIRGKFIVFYPAPEQDMTVTLAYLKTSSVLKTLDDVVDLPNNAYYAIKDYMRFRAYQKLNNSTESSNSFTFFQKQIDNMKLHSITRDDGLDSWSIENTANV
jgi:hypothetical protein